MKASTKGKVPLSQRSTENSDFEAPAAHDTSLLRLDPKIRKYLNDKGLAYRWISRREFEANGNFHKHEWEPHRFDKTEKSAGEFQIGTNPDGYIIRKEMVLATKKLEFQRAHRARIAQKTAAQTGVQQQAARELKQALQGTNATVYEGYERNGDGDGDDE